MVEWLPSGCSKALGVEKLCQKLGIDPSTELLAMGDGENDVERLQLASIGVAVGNAGPLAQEASDFVVTEKNDEGGAGAAMDVLGFGLYYM
jgi:hydroxymethylpyrimidine pyrophosphatase-like HAD family hydrolase